MGAGYSGRDRLIGTIGLQIPNLRGTGQKLDFSWEFGSRRKQFLVGFTEPWLFDTPTTFREEKTKVRAEVAGGGGGGIFIDTTRKKKNLKNAHLKYLFHRFFVF